MPNKARRKISSTKSCATGAFSSRKRTVTAKNRSAGNGKIPLLSARFLATKQDIAVIIAAIAGFLVGMAWYGILGEKWMAALGKSKNDLLPGDKPPVATMATSFVCELVMAWILAGLLGHIGAVTVGGGIISAFFVWLGFIATTQLVNHRYGRYPLSLTIIDTGHWLAVLVVMGIVIGLIGA